MIPIFYTLQLSEPIYKKFELYSILSEVKKNLITFHNYKFESINIFLIFGIKHKINLFTFMMN